MFQSMLSAAPTNLPIPARCTLEQVLLLLLLMLLLLQLAQLSELALPDEQLVRLLLALEGSCNLVLVLFPLEGF